MPYPSSLNLSQDNNSQSLIKAKGVIEETLACLKMLCFIYKIDFNKEYLKGLINEKIKTNESMNLEIFRYSIKLWIHDCQYL